MADLELKIKVNDASKITEVKKANGEEVNPEMREKMLDSTLTLIAGTRVCRIFAGILT